MPEPTAGGMDGWLAFKYAIWVLGSVVTALLAVVGYFAKKLSSRVDDCVTQPGLDKLLNQQAEAEVLRTRLQLQMHAQNKQAMDTFVETTKEAFRRIEKKIDVADTQRQQLANTVNDINLKVAVLMNADTNPPPRFNHNR